MKRPDQDEESAPRFSEKTSTQKVKALMVTESGYDSAVKSHNKQVKDQCAEKVNAYADILTAAAESLRAGDLNGMSAEAKVGTHTPHRHSMLTLIEKEMPRIAASYERMSKEGGSLTAIKVPEKEELFGLAKSNVVDAIRTAKIEMLRALSPAV